MPIITWCDGVTPEYKYYIACDFCSWDDGFYDSREEVLSNAENDGFELIESKPLYKFKCKFCRERENSE